jgi:hypothetical protein
MISFLLVLAQAALPCPSPARPVEVPSVIVQVVDEAWIPLPGIEVVVKRLDKKEPVLAMRTDKNGSVGLHLPSQADYAVEAKYPSLKSAKVKSFHTFTRSEAYPSAYIQLRMLPSGKPVTVN